MNTMMLALLQGRLSTSATQLQHRLQAADEGADDVLARELSLVLQALEAMEQGRYGRCRECDGELEVDQLLSQPHRLTCPECEARSRSASRRLFTALVSDKPPARVAAL